MSPEMVPSPMARLVLGTSGQEQLDCRWASGRGERRTFEVEASMSTALLNYFRSRQDDLLAGVRALVEQESPTRDAAATTAVIAKLKTRLDTIGAATKLHETQHGTHLVSLKTFGQSLNGGPVLLLGHVDTVWPRATLSRI